MAIHEIRVGSIGKDARGEDVAREAQRTMGIEGLEKVKTARVYRLEGVTEEEAKTLSDQLFCEPMNSSRDKRG